nr:MAG TPA: hypothetical protein [Crassvirales sp.]
MNLPELNWLPFVSNTNALPNELKFDETLDVTTSS